MVNKKLHNIHGKDECVWIHTLNCLLGFFRETKKKFDLGKFGKQIGGDCRTKHPRILLIQVSELLVIRPEDRRECEKLKNRWEKMLEESKRDSKRAPVFNFHGIPPKTSA